MTNTSLSSAEMQKVVKEAEQKLKDVASSGKRLGLMEGAELGAWGVETVMRLLPYILSLEADQKTMREVLADLQSEHCDTHCGNGDHVRLCQNASRAVLSSLEVHD